MRDMVSFSRLSIAYASSSNLPILAMKSAGDLARQAAL
jgi:hypothetical protein